MVEALFNLKNQLITCSNFYKQLYKNIINNEHKKFISIIDKIDKTDIIQKVKPGSYFKRKLFFI